MAISKTVSYAKVEDLNCDPLNPRLGRHRMDPATPQSKLLEWMTEWTIHWHPIVVEGGRGC